MQILPTLHTSPGEALVHPKQDSERAAADFEAVLNEAEDMLVPQGQAPIQTTNLYTRHTTDGYTYSLDEVCFTQKEVGELYTNLLAKGAPVSCLERLKKLTELPGGANLGQVMVSLKGGTNTENLSDEDANNITSLLDGLDPTGSLSSSVLDSIYAQDPVQALRTLDQALEEHEPSELISVSKQDLLSLGRGLGLKETELSNLVGIFGEAESGTLPVFGLQKLISPAKAAVLSDKSNQEKLTAALNETLTPILGKARKRMASEATSQTLKLREAAHSETMIDRSVQKESRRKLNEVLDRVRLDEGAGDLVFEPLPERQEEDLFAASSTKMRAEKTESLFVGHNEGRLREAVKQAAEIKRAKLELNQLQLDEPPISPESNFTLPEPVPFLQKSYVSETKSPEPSFELSPIIRPLDLGNLAAQNMMGELNRQRTFEQVSSQELESLNGDRPDNALSLSDFETQAGGDDFLNDLSRHNNFQDVQSRNLEARRLRNLRRTGNSPSLERSVHYRERSEISATRAFDRVA